MILSILSIGSIINYALRWITQTAKRAATYALVNKLIIPKYESLTLENIVKEFVKDKKTQDKIVKLFETDTNFIRAKAFVEFLKKFNLELAKDSLKAGIILPEAGYMTSRLLNAIAWSYGFGWLSWVALSPILSELIANPVREKLEKEFPDKKLTKSEVIKLRKLGLIGDKLLEVYLKDLGYTDEAIDRIKDMIKAETTEEDRNLTKSDILRAYREGLIDRVRAEMELGKLGYDKDEINILLGLEDKKKQMGKKVKEKELSTSTILKAYKKNVISKEDAIMRLKALGYDADEIEILLKLADLDKNVEKHVRNRDLTKSDILMAFRLGLLNFDMAKRMLMQIGYDEDEAELLLAITYLRYIAPKLEKKEEM